MLTLSPMRLFNAVGRDIELAAQNTGAIARRSGPQKNADTFASLRRFPDRRPAEVTVVDGLDDTSAIVRAERHHIDGVVEPLWS